jgi:hypothetical protein
LGEDEEPCLRSREAGGNSAGVTRKITPLHSATSKRIPYPRPS